MLENDESFLLPILQFLHGQNAHITDESGKQITDPTDINQLLNAAGYGLLSIHRRVGYEEQESQPVADAKGGVVDWRERFGRLDHSFVSGERVFASVFVETITPDTIICSVDDQDGRMADRFEISMPDDDFVEAVQRYQGVALSCVLRIDRAIRMGPSDIHVYTATIDSDVIIPPFNPTLQQLESISEGARVYFEGTVTDMHKTRGIGPRGRDSDMYFLSLEFEDGRQVQLPHYSDAPRYGGGSMELVTNSSMEIGEKIRIMGYKDSRVGTYPVSLHWSTPFLLIPSLSKQQHFTLERTLVRESMEQLKEYLHQNTWKKARAVFAELRTQKLTDQEAIEMGSAYMFFPDNEAPIQHGARQRSPWAGRADEIFDVRIESMNKDTFLKFVKSVGIGKIEMSDATGGAYLFLIMQQSQCTQGEKYSVLKATFDVRLSHLERNSEELNDWWDDYAMWSQAIGYMSHIPTQEALETIYSMVRYSVEKDLYERRHSHRDTSNLPYRFSHILSDATGALRGILSRYPEFFHTLPYPDEIVSWIQKIGQFPEFNEESLENLIEVVHLSRAG